MPSMPMLERTALQMATGQILDVGAGSGCHALALQDMGKETRKRSALWRLKKSEIAAPIGSFSGMRIVVAILVVTIVLVGKDK